MQSPVLHHFLHPGAAQRFRIVEKATDLVVFEGSYIDALKAWRMLYGTHPDTRLFPIRGDALNQPGFIPWSDAEQVRSIITRKGIPCPTLEEIESVGGFDPVTVITAFTK